MLMQIHRKRLMPSLLFVEKCDRDQRSKLYAMGCISYAIHHRSSFRTLSTRFEPLYTNMYLISPSDGTVSHYTCKLEIYGATSVYDFGRIIQVFKKYTSHFWLRTNKRFITDKAMTSFSLLIGHTFLSLSLSFPYS